MILAPSTKIADWYWIAKDGRIYCSARNKLVYAYDTNYLAFLAVHNATKWPTDTSGNQTNDALQQVLTTYGIIGNFS